LRLRQNDGFLIKRPVFVKCLCGSTYKDCVKVEPRAVSKGGVGDAMPPMDRVRVRVARSFGSFATCRAKSTCLRSFDMSKRLSHVVSGLSVVAKESFIGTS